MYRNFFKVLKQSLITDILLFFDNEGNMLNFLEILKLKSVSTMTCSNSLSSLPYMMLSQKMPNTQIILCPNFFFIGNGENTSQYHVIDYIRQLWAFQLFIHLFINYFEHLL